jgi:hypothetical protein
MQHPTRQPDALAPDTSPQAEYGLRLRRHQEEEKTLEARERKMADWRLWAFGLALLTLWLALGKGWFAAGWAAVPLSLFFVLVVLHDRVIQRRRVAGRAVAYYRQGLERLAGRWSGKGVDGERFRDPAHPYAEDLDLFGRGSLFELLCTARTRSGEETLAAWLLAPAGEDAVRERQAAVSDLHLRLDLREDLALLGEEVRAAVHVETLAKWGAAPVTLRSNGVRLAAGVVAVGTLTGAAVWAAGISPVPFWAMVGVGQALAAPFGDRVREALKGVEQARRELALFSHLLERVEREEFEAPLLRDLRARLDTGGLPPSQRLARLERLMILQDAQRNGLFAIVGLALLWSLQVAFAVEAWRGEHGKHLEGWFAVMGEIEALCALAGYAYEHPEDPFPEITPGGPLFEAQGLGHPLLPHAAAVRNDVSLGASVRLLIVSGSNMSGKSTLLRTVGANAVLALAGAPVRAARLRLSPLSIGASIRTQDSLQGGTSRFYAEITRLRQIVDLTGRPVPLLFLLDEILHGTNSHDRRIGAEAVARALLRKGAVGLVTTHDLALARIAEDASIHAINVHFQDSLADGKMSFDYHLRPGVVEKSNALELMRAVGLEV